MSDESKPDDNESTRRYTLWRDLSANARFPSEDFVARAALNTRPERDPAEGLNQFRSEYPVQQATEEVSVPVALPPPPPERSSPLINTKTAGAVAALFVVGFSVAVGIKQWQSAPATVVLQSPSSESRPVAAPPSNPVETLAAAEPVNVPADSAEDRPGTPAESTGVVTPSSPPPVAAPVERTIPADTRNTSPRADASTTSQPDRPAASLTANARATVASTPSIAPVPVTAPDPPPLATNRETPVNASASGAVDVAVPAAVRNTPVATTGAEVPSVASAPSTTEGDLRPAPLDRPVPALSNAAPAPIAAVPTVTPTAAIQRTLQGYQSAFSRLDVNAVRQVWPSVDQKALAKAFDQLKSEDLTLENCKVTVTGANAVAACGGKTEYVPKIGSKTARVERHQWRISLQQVADRWVVHQVDVTAP